MSNAHIRYGRCPKCGTPLIKERPHWTSTVYLKCPLPEQECDQEPIKVAAQAQEGK